MPTLLCKCMKVTEPEVRRAIRRGARSIERIGETCEAGTGCTSCHPALKTLLAEEAAFIDENQLGLFQRKPKT